MGSNTKDYQKRWRRSITGVLNKSYSSQVRNSIVRGHKPPTYSLDELTEFAISNPEFHILYNLYKNSGFDTELRPSFDRLNDYEGYSLSNIQISTWGENRRRIHRDKINGINNKISKEVMQFTKDMSFIMSYYSVGKAYRDTGILHIAECASGNRKSAGGFIWKYMEV